MLLPHTDGLQPVHATPKKHPVPAHNFKNHSRAFDEESSATQQHTRVLPGIVADNDCKHQFSAMADVPCV